MYVSNSQLYFSISTIVQETAIGKSFKSLYFFINYFKKDKMCAMTSTVQALPIDLYRCEFDTQAV